MNRGQKHIYADYAASTPVDARVLAVMRPYYDDRFANPGAVHVPGQHALKAVDESRGTLAQALGAKFEEIVFTGSASEANNLALRGAVMHWQRTRGAKRTPRVVISAIEHSSVSQTAKMLENEGVEVVVLSVDEYGRIDEKRLARALNARTVLVSLIYASNEIGTIQPIARVGAQIREFRASRKSGAYPLFHTDAVQAWQYIKLNVDELCVDMLSVSAQKIYGPKGVGALYVRETAQTHIDPIITGGSQEFGLRSGTENVPAIVGFAAAVEDMEKKREKEVSRMRTIQTLFWERLQKNVSDVVLNGTAFGPERLPNNCNVCFSGRDAYDLLVRLDLAGIACSAGSACAARAFTPSQVVAALPTKEDRAGSSLRFSFGRYTTKKEVEEIIRTITQII
jgi:cysteine desulfurase